MRPASDRTILRRPLAWLAVAILAGGCHPANEVASAAHPAPAATPPLGERHVTPTIDAAGGRVQLERPAMVRFHMRRHFEDLRMIERLLVAGKLEDARALAHLLAKPARDPGFAPWAAESQRLTDAALALASATSLEEACRREPRVSEACASCHVRMQTTPVFGIPPPLPLDLPTRKARMARHQWAVDRLWEAMVGPSESSWHGGLEVLAAAPMPFPVWTEASRYARRLQELARDQLPPYRTTSLADRAAAYGELLVTCVGCHAHGTVTRATR
ncbi:MAG TPA: hypothetical protein VFT22_30640 [Kofleriaceae bacterium]|nr:hypothetical protein [Kofleriaceae bacterium]